MNNEFLIVKNMKIFINSIDNIIVNYPRKEMVIKKKIIKRFIRYIRKYISC